MKASSKPQYSLQASTDSKESGLLLQQFKEKEGLLSHSCFDEKLLCACQALLEAEAQEQSAFSYTNLN